jgi:hypothetical protein
MPSRWIGPTALLLFSLSQASWASAEPQNESAQPESAAPQAAPASTVDVSRLPVNLSRIQRQLQRSTVREERDGLNLRYLVDVFGQAPAIELFSTQDNLLDGPVPYGGPTHRDILQVITPQEHRAPAANFGNLFRWLADKAKDE